MPHTESTPVRTWLSNPIAYAFAGIGGVLSLAAAVYGVNLADVLQLAFIPYTYDMSHGVGKTPANYIAAVLLGLQMVLITMTGTVHRLSHVTLRRFLWVLGVAFVVAYFTITALGFFVTVFH